jgi:PAS domain S-box-containing protein
MKKFFSSIPVKICLSLLGIKTILLAFMGVYYTNKFCEEIDRNLKNKLLMPSVLFAHQDLNVNRINKKSFENILQERVHDVFIAKPDGTIYYSEIPKKDGEYYKKYLSNEEKKQFKEINNNFAVHQIVKHKHNGKNFISVLSPIGDRKHFTSVLYIKLDGDVIAARKQEIITVFFFGSLLTIVVSSLFEALILHHLFVPRINKTRVALSLVEQGNLSVRIPQADSPDQLGSLMRHVNRMIAATERDTRLLRMVNEAGASFVTADSLEKLSELINKEVSNLQKYFTEPARFPLTPQGSKKPSLAPDPDQGFQLPLRDKLSKREKSQPDEEKYLFPLLNMANSAFFRLQSWQQSRDAEQKYRALFSSAVEGIFRCTMDGILEVANPALAKMMGYSSPQSMIELFEQEKRLLLGRAEEQEQLFYQINEQGQVQDVEIRPQRRDGFYFWASLTAHAKLDQNKQPRAIEGRIVNIEERKRRERIEYDYLTAQAANQAKTEMLGELEAKNNELERALAELHNTQRRMIQAERMATIGMTTSGVAHDLNNILAGVVNYAEMILYQLPEKSKTRTSVQCILESGKRAADVVADLLTLTRGTAHNRTPIILNTIITEYLSSAEFQYLAEQHPQIHITADLAQDLFPVPGISVYLHKIIMNLVTNSFEAIQGTTSQGKVKIITQNLIVPSENIFSQNDGKQYVVLKIIDNGAGIEQKDIQHIYEPFYSNKPLGQSGTGLGLTMVQNAVIEHQGTIKASSNAQQGTTFTIRLPVISESCPAPVTKKNDQKDTIVTGNGTVLVVDDNPTMREIAKSILIEAGYTVHLARSGEEALQFCQGQKADLVLLDMLMPPGMNGRETFTAIRRIYPHQKALIVSGYSEDIEVQKALQAGCSGFLKKPYTMSQLSQAIQQALQD